MSPSDGNYSHVRRTAPTHITWKVIRTYTTTYAPNRKLPKKLTKDNGVPTKAARRLIVVRSITRPKRYKYFQTSRGLRKFKAVQVKSTTREVIIVARTKQRKKPVDQEELEELEALEELEDLEDEVDEEEPEVEDDEDEDADEDDEEEEEPPKKAKSKAKAKKAPASRAKENGKVGTQELAAHVGIDGRTLRIVLRKHNIQKDPETGRYEWDSLNDREVKRIVKLIKSGEAERAKRESLDRLKAKKEAQREAAKAAKGKKGKKAKKAPEPELDDEVDDEDIEDEDEEETPAPKKRRAAKKTSRR